ncbi:NAD-dependent epimerase/dehydratase [Melioribacter roseus P3M-2]|uniref:NAD-dependent epimerase/dehydratase n=1 Tax=Melioribacter roseus (strain DSM 23840 / JCM 17771 / VKM B-2668 / P3M-2) TaxID=1191523 RepID=I7A2K7_MELRP|nr:SDR family oxidoreductase [Melioribacter roseus]AFN75408.1 NAD-dependent epimerase/dehydratase [Melioribacter roseus P3M-2]
MKNVLVVGGAGYVGGAITDLLLDSNYNVRVYDVLLYEDSFRKPVDFVFGDVRDAGKLKPHLEWADAVVWLAAIVGDGACQLNPQLTKSINQDSVSWLADNYDGRIIFMSTCSVYGAQDKELDENSPTNPLSLYAETKLNAEKYLKHKNAMIFRLGTLFGVGDLYSRIRLDLVVNILTVRAYVEGQINVFGGDQFRPLLHVKDVAIAVVQNIETEHKGVFNLARQNVRIMDLAYQVRMHFPDLIIEHTDMPFQDTRNYRVSAQKAKDTFGFKSVHSIDEGIEELKYLVETKRIKDLKSPRYSNQAYLKEHYNELMSEKFKEVEAA